MRGKVRFELPERWERDIEREERERGTKRQRWERDREAERGRQRDKRETERQRERGDRH